MCEKRARMGRKYKHINLHKIQRSNELVSQYKESLERHNDSLKNKSPQIRFIPFHFPFHGRLELVRAVSMYGPVYMEVGEPR